MPENQAPLGQGSAIGEFDMKYDFDEIIDRKNSNSIKWDVADGELPMWVADMDFKTAPSVLKALEDRVAHGIFGYGDVTDDWYSAYGNWWKNRHGFELKKDWLIFCTGVVPAISSIVRMLTTPAEKVVIQTPVYNIFFNSILNNGRQVLESPLKYENGVYSCDFDDLEEKLSDPQASLMILCNPHNPVGKIWSREDLAKVGELCKKYNVTVVSDEIHCDLTDPEKEYIPFASVSETCREISVTCVAPTKTFNIAGLQTAAVSVPNAVLRHKVWRGLNTDEVAEPNAFAVCAAVAAFNGGGEWLDELRAYLFENKKAVREFVAEKIPELKVVPSEATYLLWLDCSSLDCDSREFAKLLRKETGLFVSNGSQYGRGGEHFLRLNVACPKSLVIDGLDRLERGVRAYLNK